MNNPLMIIRVDHLIDNLRTIEKVTGCQVIPVMKSDAYGLGAGFLCETLVRSGITYLAMNTFDEARNLFDLNGHIIILSSLNEHELISCDPHPGVVFSVNNLEDVQKLSCLTHRHAVHIGIDTGMNRTGCRSLSEAKAMIQELQKNPHIDLEGIYTHFASGPEDADYYRFQCQNFQKYLSLYPFKVVHTANSASLAKPLIGSYVRIGIALYGYNTSIEGLKKCVHVYAKPVNLFRLAPGECLGYDMVHQAFSEETIGVLPIGYNEGLLRGLEGFELTHQDNRYPIVGKLCMNHCFILADDKINYHSTLEVIGKDDKIYRMAEQLNCPVHQILCTMHKIKKIYLTREMGNHDFSIIGTSGNKKSFKIRKRTRSSQNPHP